MNTIVYFSPTGNVKYLAHGLVDEIGREGADIFPLEFTDPSGLAKTDHLIIMFAIHAFNSPRTVGRFVNGLPEGLCKKVSLIAVGCADSWINKGATLGLRKILQNKGYVIHVDKQMAMPLSFVISFPEEMVSSLVEAGRSQMKDVAHSIKQGIPVKTEVPFKSRVINMIGKIEDPAARLFGLELRAGKDCTSCGVCVKNCPEGNIKFNKNDRPKFGLNCLMCMRCIYNCPEKTITPRLAKFIPVKGGYVPPKINQTHLN